MTKHVKLLSTAVAASAVLSLSAMAKTAPSKSEKPPVAASAPASPTPEQIADFRRGIEIFRSFGVDVESKNVKPAVKNRLIACLYANKLGDISRATAKLIKSQPALSDEKPQDVWRAAARVCGITFNKPASASPAPAPLKNSSQ